MSNDSKPHGRVDLALCSAVTILQMDLPVRNAPRNCSNMLD